MEIVCYAFENKNKELEAPFLEYLEKYALGSKDSEKKTDQKVKRQEHRGTKNQRSRWFSPNCLLHKTSKHYHSPRCVRQTKTV